MTIAEDCDGSDDCTSGRDTFTLEKEDGVYKAIYDDYGIEKEWIKFSDNHVYLNNGCQYSNDINKCIWENDNWYWNYPQASEYVKVSNPKDITGGSDDKSTDLLLRLNVLITMADYDELEDLADLVDAAMLFALHKLSRQQHGRDCRTG